MSDREKIIGGLEIQLDDLQKYADSDEILTLTQEQAKEIVALLKEQEALLKHEYWRGYNNGRADERGLQEGTIMQTFSPD